MHGFSIASRSYLTIRVIFGGFSPERNLQLPQAGPCLRFLNGYTWSAGGDSFCRRVADNIWHNRHRRANLARNVARWMVHFLAKAWAVRDTKGVFRLETILRNPTNQDVHFYKLTKLCILPGILHFLSVLGTFDRFSGDIADAVYVGTSKADDYLVSLPSTKQGTK